jgi:hypothetical protein
MFCSPRVEKEICSDSSERFSEELDIGGKVVTSDTDWVFQYYIETRCQILQKTVHTSREMRKRSRNEDRNDLYLSYKICTGFYYSSIPRERSAK